MAVISFKHTFSGWLRGRKNGERRVTRGAALSRIELLESRLCLGSITAPDLGHWHADDEAGAALAAEVADEPFAESEAAARPNGKPTAPQPAQPPVAQSSDSPALAAAVATQVVLAAVDPALGTALANSSGSSPRGDGEADSGGPGAAASAAATAGFSVETGGFGAGVSNEPGLAGLAAAGVAAAGSATGGSEAAGGLNGDTLSAIGMYMDADGNFLRGQRIPAWWQGAEEPIVVRYDFRDFEGYENQITDDQKAAAIAGLDAWTQATDGILVFEQDVDADISQIINIGVGDLAAGGYYSEASSILGLGGGVVYQEPGEDIVVTGVAWLDAAETWDTQMGNGDVTGTFDFFTVAAHEVGHALGLGDSYGTYDGDIMTGYYISERDVSAIRYAIDHGIFATTIQSGTYDGSLVPLHAQVDVAAQQLTAAEVNQLLERASAALPSQDRVIAIVDRGGTILGARAEAGVIANVDAQGNVNGVIDTAGERSLIAFMIDGAVSKARTAAFFSNGDPNNGTLAPITSRLVRFISQTTITEREVESVPNEALPVASTVRGPGFVAPIGLGGHFPPEIMFTPQVDLFAIEHTNRDRIDVALDPEAVQHGRAVTDPESVANPAENLFPEIAPPVAGASDRIHDPSVFLVQPGQTLRFGINEALVAPGMEAALREPLSFGETSGLDPSLRSRGISTLPGGIPIFRDANGDRVGDTLIGGIGVFFPGPDGFATHEQHFVPGIGQTETDRTNTSTILQDEFIAFAALDGSLLAAFLGVPLAKPSLAGFGNYGGGPPVPGIDLPFGRLDLVGITLQVIGPIAGRVGVGEVIQAGQAAGFTHGMPSGININPEPADNPANPVAAETGVVATSNFVNPATNTRGGTAVPFGSIVPPQNGNGITAAEVQDIITRSITTTQVVRAAIRLNTNGQPNAPTRMVHAVADLDGQIVGLFRQQDATIFSIDVAIAKARNVAYYSSTADLEEVDRLDGVGRGIAFTNRTFRYLAEPRFPEGIDFNPPGPFSILNEAGINRFTAENIGAPRPYAEFVGPDDATVQGNNSFNPNSNFRDDDNDGVDLFNQNGIVFFPGSSPLYRRDGSLIGGFGISGDGVDQDDVVTFMGGLGFLPQGNGIVRADQVTFRGVRLPYQKFLRNPFGGDFRGPDPFAQGV